MPETISEDTLQAFEASLDELSHEHFDDQPLIQLRGDNAENFPSINQLRALIAAYRERETLQTELCGLQNQIHQMWEQMP